MNDALKVRFDRIMNGGPGSGRRPYATLRTDATNASSEANAATDRAKNVAGEGSTEHGTANRAHVAALRAHLDAKNAAETEGKPAEAQEHFSKALEHQQMAGKHLEAFAPIHNSKISNGFAPHLNASSTVDRSPYESAYRGAQDASSAAHSNKDAKSHQTLHEAASKAHGKAKDEAVKIRDYTNADYHNIMEHSHNNRSKIVRPEVPEPKKLDFSRSMFSNRKVMNDAGAGGAGGAGGGAPSGGVSQSSTVPGSGRLGSLSPAPMIKGFASGASQGKKKNKALLDELRNTAAKNNGYLPTMKGHFTKKEIENARKLLPIARPGLAKNGSKRSVKIMNGISKGKSVDFTLAHKRDFSKDKNGPLTAEWVSPKWVDDDAEERLT